MHVSNVMSSPPATCRSTTQLGQAAKAMAEHNCGCLPVVDDRGCLIGLVTDRDVCLMVADRHKSPWQVAVRDAMTQAVVSCAPEDTIESALAKFEELGVRRLPVVDQGGHVKGLLSIDDLVLYAGQSDLSEQAVMKAFRAVCRAETGKVVERK